MIHDEIIIMYLKNQLIIFIQMSVTFDQIFLAMSLLFQQNYILTNQSPPPPLLEISSLCIIQENAHAIARRTLTAIERAMQESMK